MPVVMVQKEVKKNAPKSLEVLVDDKCAVENITRFATINGYQTDVKKDGDEFQLTLTKEK